MASISLGKIFQLHITIFEGFYPIPLYWTFTRLSGELTLFRNQINNFIIMKPVNTTWWMRCGEIIFWVCGVDSRLNSCQLIFIFYPK